MPKMVSIGLGIVDEARDCSIFKRLDPAYSARATQRITVNPDESHQRAKA
jgi:hypothetical protein